MQRPPLADALTVQCPAKVNLALAVGPPDDTGFHPIATWMVALDLADTLTLRRLGDEAAESAHRIRFADDALRPGAVDWPLQRDLAYRAHRALERAVDRALPIELTLEKRIPTGAGLGGGSSDAAGVLWGLNELFALNLPARALRERAAALGSDVPFLLAALRGAPSALATGHGEQLEPAPLAAPLHLVLVLPPLACATAEVYAAFDAMPGREAPLDPSRVRELAAGGLVDVSDDALFNDLTDAACAVCPPLAAARERVRATVNRHVHVTGSGAAMFVLARDGAEAEDFARRITAETGLATVAAQSLSSCSTRER